MTNQNKIPCINANPSKNAINVASRLAFLWGVLFFVVFALEAKNPPKIPTQNTQNTKEAQNTNPTKESQTAQNPKESQSSTSNESASATQTTTHTSAQTSAKQTSANATKNTTAESSEQKNSTKNEKSIQSQPCNELCEYIRQKTSTTKHKNGYFIAVNGGANVLEMYNKLVWIPTFGLAFGVNSFFTPYIGVRGYVSADVGFGDYDGVLGMLSLGIEALAEFSLNKRKTVFLGGFLGFGVDGYVYYDRRDFSSFSSMQKNGGFYMQGGVSFAFLRHNRLNIATRFIPARSVQDFSSAVLAFGQYSYTF